MKFNKRAFLSYAVVCHPILAIIQMILLDYFNISEQNGTLFHVACVAIIMIPAILISYKMKPDLFMKTYLFVIILLVINILVFPQNTPYLLNESLQFFLSIVIPCIICILCIGDLDIFMTAVYKMSIFFTCLMVFYVYLILTNKIIAENYSMYLGYASLLPMLVLYQRKTKYSLMAFAFLFIYVIIWGNRGAVVASFIFVVYDIIISKKSKYLILCAIIAIGIFLINLEAVASLLYKFGIESRSINKLIYGGFDESEGREMVYSRMTKVLQDNWEGIGLWGDRLHLDGSWCHNIFLEILLDFGVMLGSVVIFVLLFIIIKTYIKNNVENRKLLFLFFCSSIIPLLLSNSYLRDYKFGIFMGVLLVLYRNGRKRMVRLI